MKLLIATAAVVVIAWAYWDMLRDPGTVYPDAIRGGRFSAVCGGKGAPLFCGKGEK